MVFDCSHVLLAKSISMPSCSWGFGFEVFLVCCTLWGKTLPCWPENLYWFQKGILRSLKNQKSLVEPDIVGKDEISVCFFFDLFRIGVMSPIYGCTEKRIEIPISIHWSQYKDWIEHSLVSGVKCLKPIASAWTWYANMAAEEITLTWFFVNNSCTKIQSRVDYS